MLLVFTSGLVPPPFLFNPLPGQGAPPPSHYSCSLSFLVRELGERGYRLRHFAGAYSLFLREDRLAAELAADEFDCFRHSDILLDDAGEISLASVREWFFGEASVEDTLGR